VDNDCDGRTDCSDTECVSDPACVTCRPEVCWDGIDNDCDTIVDCEDSDCIGHPSCEECFPEVCDDNLDNDCDGGIDCDDADCADDPYCLNRNDTCTDAREIEFFGTYYGSTAGYANDYTGSCAGNGPDAVFYGYNATTRCIEIDTLGSTWDTVLYVRRSRCVGGTEIGCNDDYPPYGLQSRLRFDNLEPGLYFVFVDGWSSGSFGDYVLNIRECSALVEICNNGRDDDGDFMVDCDDPDCAMDPSCRCQPYETSCTDGRDNDCDGMYDCEDWDCEYDPACCEPFETSCMDGRDNDCDGMYDCEDWDCWWDPFCTGECEPFETNCRDGRDNDCDGMWDCEDPECWEDPWCWWDGG